MRIAVLDDYQSVALECADWDRLRRRGCSIDVFHQPLESAERVVEVLGPYDVLVPMRERLPLPRAVIERLPSLKFVGLTGLHSATLDMQTCAERSIPVSNTRSERTTSVTAELTLALLLMAARHAVQADGTLRSGRWQQGLGLGIGVEGRTLGLVGVGTLGTRVAHFARALGMHVLGWSPNLTRERASEAGVESVTKDELLMQSDFVSLHLVLSERTRGIVGAPEFARMKPGAILINTARGALVDERAMLDALRTGRLRHAALDVFEREPLPEDHPLLRLSNVTLIPHLGYVVEEVFAEWYGDVVENIEAWMDGRPIRVINGVAGSMAISRRS